ncbi:hypothetical protein D3C78_1787450 [compost metagenome]
MPERRPLTKMAANGMMANHMMLVERMPPLTYTIQLTMPNIDSTMHSVTRRSAPLSLSSSGPSSSARPPTRMPLPIAG